MKIRQLIIFLLLYACPAFAQTDPDTPLPGIDKIASSYVNTVDKKAAAVSRQLNRQTEKYLDRLEKQEARIQKKLAKIDSLAAHNIFSHTASQYQDIRNKLQSKSAALRKNTGRYFPWLDSAGTSLQFLAAHNAVAANMSGHAATISAAWSKVKELENQFKAAASVKDFIRQRKEMLAAQLRNYNLGSELKKYNQAAYYYTQQVNDYRQVLDDPQKAERKALQLLHTLPAFEKFMKEHGELAGLFDVPEDYASNMNGLQTRSQVQAMMQERIRNIGPNAQQEVQQSISAAQAELSKLRNRFPSQGSTEDMPDFRPRQLKTKTLLQRLEYGTNLQTVRSNNFFPATTDMAVSVGYKMSEKNIAGIGASYKLGWGKDIQHMALSSEGIGFRSFADFNLKGSFFISGGFEYNYQQPFSSLSVVNNLSHWQQSGLLGISKIISLKTKYFKKTKLQLLWDALSYQQVPQGQPVKFRVGYSF